MVRIRLESLRSQSISLSALGVYQEGMAKNLVDNKPVVAHLYEYTTQLSIDPNLTFKGLEKGIVPVRHLSRPSYLD